MEAPAAQTLPVLALYDLVLAADVEEFLVLILSDQNCCDHCVIVRHSPAIRLRNRPGVTYTVLNP